MSEIALEVKNLSKRFRKRDSNADSLKGAITQLFSAGKQKDGEFEALKNVSFDLSKGEALGIIGRNGAGKSTLLRILAGISRPDDGVVNFYGKAVSILDIGAGFHPELTGRENIYLSASLYKFSKEKIEQRFNQIVEFSDIAEFIDEPVKNYSSGMYLRLAFSIITFLDADIYLIDEVINVGDANFQTKCKQRIEELITAGKTLLIASHSMNEISVLCNRIILMEHGQIVESGGPDIIQKYLTMALSQYFQFEGSEGYHKRDISEVIGQIPQLKILNSGLKNHKLVNGGISNRQGFTIYFEVQLLQPVNLEIKMRFYDATGVLIFACTNMQSTVTANTTGAYSIEFNVPPNIFNDRLYTVDLFLSNISTETLFTRIDKFLVLKMVDDKPENVAESGMRLPGLIKPGVTVEVRKV